MRKSTVSSQSPDGKSTWSRETAVGSLLSSTQRTEPTFKSNTVHTDNYNDQRFNPESIASISDSNNRELAGGNNTNEDEILDEDLFLLVDELSQQACILKKRLVEVVARHQRELCKCSATGCKCFQSTGMECRCALADAGARTRGGVSGSEGWPCRELACSNQLKDDDIRSSGDASVSGLRNSRRSTQKNIDTSNRLTLPRSTFRRSLSEKNSENSWKNIGHERLSSPINIPAVRNNTKEFVCYSIDGCPYMLANARKRSGKAEMNADVKQPILAPLENIIEHPSDTGTQEEIMEQQVTNYQIKGRDNSLQEQRGRKETILVTKSFVHKMDIIQKEIISLKSELCQLTSCNCPNPSKQSSFSHKIKEIEEPQSNPSVTTETDKKSNGS